MRINADFSQRVVICPEDYRWVDSPMAGVERMMLDRIGDEVARATSLVRYAPNSRFAEHVHGGGEEFFVLEGVFGDEHRDYPAGTYVRNPIGTRHSPRVGAEGCVIFVKLHQFDAADDRQAVIDTRKAAWQSGGAAGAEVLPLHRFSSERVSLARLAHETPWPGNDVRGGAEFFVIDGGLRDDRGAYPAGSWLRLPDGGRAELSAGGDGALLFVKTGHLPTLS
ncbi:MAG: cupin domain-containing protein [Woeseiaceae bacterium]|nr:cupin domain-containing protein [Woeseiaceae bacterium]